MIRTNFGNLTCILLKLDEFFSEREYPCRQVRVASEVFEVVFKFLDIFGDLRVPPSAASNFDCLNAMRKMTSNIVIKFSLRRPSKRLMMK